VPAVSRNEVQILNFKCLFIVFVIKQIFEDRRLFGFKMFVTFYLYAGDRSEIYGTSVLESLYHRCPQQVC
jgi:hypothetical protein